MTNLYLLLDRNWLQIKKIIATMIKLTFYMMQYIHIYLQNASGITFLLFSYLMYDKE